MSLKALLSNGRPLHGIVITIKDPSVTEALSERAEFAAASIGHVFDMACFRAGYACCKSGISKCVFDQVSKHLWYNFFLPLLLLFALPLAAEIREIQSIDEIFTEIHPDTIVLMDIDETLIESSIMLGGKAWRSYALDLLKKNFSEQKMIELRNQITYQIAQHVPCIAVESSIHHCLDRLRERQIPVFGFTAREKKYWHTMLCEDAEALTFLHLRQAGFELEAFSTFSSHSFLSHRNFSRGVFFSDYFKDKGKLALELFAQDRPAHILFVDDKMDNVCAMDRACTQLGIPAICFCYRHVELYRSFDPLIAAIQLEKLLLGNLIVSDGEAALLKQAYEQLDPNLLFLEIIDLYRR